MVRQAPSIFNDIVGPIMVGPSSSHTCGPSRIGYLAQQLITPPLKSCVVAFAREGAYTEMYKGQRSDLGFVNGLLGRRPEDPRLRHAYDEARAAGVSVTFEIQDFPPVVPNIAHLHLENAAGERITVYSDSTGGGTVRILAVDGFDTDIVGDCYELLLWTDCGAAESEAVLAQAVGLFAANEGTSLSEKDGRCLLNIKARVPFTPEQLRAARALPHVRQLRTMAPILTVLSNRSAVLPFRSAEEMLAVSADTGKPLHELAIDYEMARAGWSRAQVVAEMEKVIDIMESGVREALKGQIDMAGILSPTAGKIENYCKTDRRAVDMGVLATAVPWSMAAMEYSSAQGVVACAPTGGSAGVFPGAILGTCTHMGLGTPEKVRAMLVTSVLGIVMSKDHNYSAELYGCQVEPGAASAMAAGGLADLMGGSPLKACQAASCALQNILGTICDPVAGLVQLPCINRNAMSTANAVVSANLVMGGFDPLIPLDQAAETLFRVGKQLPSALRCTCKGGLCTTPCGQQLAAEQLERDNRR